MEPKWENINWKREQAVASLAPESACKMKTENCTIVLAAWKPLVALTRADSVK